MQCENVLTGSNILLPNKHVQNININNDFYFICYSRNLDLNLRGRKILQDTFLFRLYNEKL